MSDIKGSFFKRKISKGDPISAPGIADAIQNMAKALENLQVVGDAHIDAKIDWANGYPRITLKYKA